MLVPYGTVLSYVNASRYSICQSKFLNGTVPYHTMMKGNSFLIFFFYSKRDDHYDRRIFFKKNVRYGTVQYCYWYSTGTLLVPIPVMVQVKYELDFFR